MKITMNLPKTILIIIKVIQDKLEIAPEKDKLIAISLWDFRDENEDTIPKNDLKNGLKKLAEDEKLFQLKDIRCLDKLGRFAGEKIEFEINRERFKKFYKEHRQDLEQIKQASVIDANKIVEFLDDEPALKLGDRKCALPPYKNEHFFCRTAFEYKLNEPIDWSLVYEKMAGEEPKNQEKNKRTVYDTLIAINKRVKEVLGIEQLFKWEGKTIKRTR